MGTYTKNAPYSLNALGINLTTKALYIAGWSGKGEKRKWKYSRYNVRALVDDKYVVTRRWRGGKWIYEMWYVYKLFTLMAYPSSVNGKYWPLRIIT